MVPVELKNAMSQHYVNEAILGQQVNIKRLQEDWPTSAKTKKAIVKLIIQTAHDIWRQQQSTQDLFYMSSDESNCLNVFARAELAGREIWGIWTKRLLRIDRSDMWLLNGFKLPVSGCYSLEETSMTAFEEQRREYAEANNLTGAESLYRHVLLHWDKVVGIPSVSGKIAKALFSLSCGTRINGDNVKYRMARQIFLANDKETPIGW